VAVPDVSESLSLAVPQDSTFLRLAKLFPEEPDAAYLRYENWARPGLWGFRAGNRPVLPGGDFPHFYYTIRLDEEEFWYLVLMDVLP
jgi:hypothetical protein